MIEKLYKLAPLIPKGVLEDNPLDLNLEHSGGYIVFIHFERENESFSFKRLSVDDYDRDRNKSCYLFENLASANATPAFPTYRVNKAGTKKPEEKLKSALKKIKGSIELIDEIKSLGSLLEENQDSIEEYILEKLNFSDSFIISLKIDNETPGESELLRATREKREAELFNDFFTYSKKSYVGRDKFCNLCQKVKDEVWGYVSTFNFYAVKTELAPLAGGFDAKSAWKNYPVCPECAAKLDRGKRFLNKVFSFRFYGLRYFLLPDFLWEGEKDETKREIIDIFMNAKYGGDLKLSEERGLKLTNAEDEVFEELSLAGNATNSVNYTLFFYEINNAEFKIHASIDNIFPSRFRRMFEVKAAVEECSFFKGLPGKKKSLFDLKFNFGTVRAFFPNSKIEGDFTSSFLEVTRAIFLGKRIESHFIIHRIVDKLRGHFANGEATAYTLLEGVMLLKFLKALGILVEQEYSEEEEIRMDNQYDAFFSKHQDFFGNNTKKAVFLEGVLCQKLLNIQYQERRANPFRTKLNGMKINEKLVKKLLPEMVNKLEEYNKNYYRDLEEVIAKYLLDSKFDISNDEISFLFLMGMTLYKEFSFTKESEESNNE